MFGKIKKWIILLVLICTIIIVCLCTKYETINFVTEYENITQISSPFENVKNNNSRTKKIMRALDKIMLTRKKVPEQSTREIVYQIHIHSKGGHTEKIICYGERLLHYYDGQCRGDYYVPLITQVYLYYIYGGI